jgi:hypothetical protein
MRVAQASGLLLWVSHPKPVQGERRRSTQQSPSLAIEVAHKIRRDAGFNGRDARSTPALDVGCWELNVECF